MLSAAAGGSANEVRLSGERSARIAQDTGFGEWMRVGKAWWRLPTGTGIEAIDEISCSYKRHCIAAREVAHTYFAAEDVLTRLVDRVMNPVRTLVERTHALTVTESPADRQRR